MTIREKLNEDEETLAIGIAAFTSSILEKVQGRKINDVEYTGIKKMAENWLNGKYLGPDKEDSDDGK